MSRDDQRAQVKACHFSFGKSRLIAEAESVFCSGNAQRGDFFQCFFQPMIALPFSARQGTHLRTVSERSTSAGVFNVT